MSFRDRTRKVLGYDEGDRLRPYKDTKGYWTIGRGHLIGERLEELEISQQTLEQIFNEDIAICVCDAYEIFTMALFESWTDARRIAVLSLLFTLGKTRLLTFHQTLPAIKREDWQLAAELLKKTKWARDVDPGQRDDAGRDDRIAYMLETGEFHPDYNV